jgi:superfamily II DNA or RNA helicase
MAMATDQAARAAQQHGSRLGLYRQMAGRGLRPATGKIDLIMLDHSGAVFAHGKLEDPIVWTLETDRRAINPTHESPVQTIPR